MPDAAPFAPEGDLVQLDATTVHARLRAALVRMERAECVAVLWFAEVVKRHLYRNLGYSTIETYATEGLGFSHSRAVQFMSLARRLPELPSLRRALAEGEVGWTKARVVAAVATRATEAQWVELASTHSRRELLAAVAAARAATRRRAAAASAPAAAGSPAAAVSPGAAGPPRAAGRADSAGRPAASLPVAPSPFPIAPTRCAGASSGPPAASLATPASPSGPLVPPEAAAPETTPQIALDLGGGDVPDAGLPEAAAEIALRFGPLEYTRFKVLLEAIRKKRRGTARLTREELVLAALEEMLAAPAPERDPGRQTGPECTRVHAEPRPATAASPYRILVFRCHDCGQAWVQAGGSRRPLSSATLAKVECDAGRQDSRGHLRSGVPPAIRRAVMARDEFRCRMPGCGRTHFLEVHHLVPRAKGGGNGLGNLITLCSACHSFLHESGAAALAVKIPAGHAAPAPRHPAATLRPPDAIPPPEPG